jgi:hypothetical protein
MTAGFIDTNEATEATENVCLIQNHTPRNRKHQPQRFGALYYRSENGKIISGRELNYARTTDTQTRTHR